MNFSRKTHIDLARLLATADCPFSARYGMRVLDYEGIAWGPPSTTELVDAVKVFPLDPRDVLVTAYPKSGTNWMQIMLANFWDDWGHHKLTGSRRVPSIEFIGDGTDGYDVAVSSEPPRLMKNHLPADKMPHAWHMAKSKIVYLSRNPIDVCASLFRQLQTPGLEMDASWDCWVDRFLRGDTLYGGWLNHELGWARYGLSEGVYHLSYEALMRDPRGETRKVVDFLGKPLADTQFDDVVTKALRENMDASGFSDQITVAAENLRYYRSEGKPGGSREKFTPEQLNRIERELIVPVENVLGRLWS